MSCTALLARRWDEVVAPGSNEPFSIDLSDKLAFHRSDKVEWGAGETIRVGGFDAECIVAGRRGPYAPTFPPVAGAIVEDGGITWQVVPASSASQRTTVSIFAWAPPAGITVGGQADGTTFSSAKLQVAADAEPGGFEISIKATCANGEIYVQPCILQVQ